MILSMAGGGVPLNFKIVTYKTEEAMKDAKPAENTIGVVTNKISEYVFSATEPPDPVDDMLWIKVGSSSPRAFNALKKNSIILCPQSAKQYANGAWSEVPAMSYQNGWKNWFTYLYYHGDECKDLTGGWEVLPYKTASSESQTSTPTVTRDKNFMQIEFSSTALRAGALFTKEAVDLTDVSTLTINILETGYPETTSFGVSAEKKNNYTPAARRMISEAGTFELDVSSFTGLYYVFTALQGGENKYAKFDDIRMS